VAGKGRREEGGGRGNKVSERSGKRYRRIFRDKFRGEKRNAVNET
jgi:hypothetical protein